MCADDCTVTNTNGHTNGSNGTNGTNGQSADDSDTWWANGDQKLSWVDAGVAGVWAITPDMSVCGASTVDACNKYLLPGDVQRGYWPWTGAFWQFLEWRAWENEEHFCWVPGIVWWIKIY